MHGGGDAGKPSSINQSSCHVVIEICHVRGQSLQPMAEQNEIKMSIP
jgi:hypothetical protein